MDLIRVDPEQLKRAASEIEGLGENYGALARQALDVVQGAPSYEGQFGPRVSSTGHEAHARLSGLANLLTELQQELFRIAEAFAAADATSAAGFHALAMDMQKYWDAGLGSLLYSLFRPAHISEEAWNRLPLEDRIAILQSYGLAFLLSSDTAAGTVLYPTNPLRVRADPGLNGNILSYAAAGSEVTYTGHSRTVDGVGWYQVKFEDPIHGWLIGWVSSSYLSTGRSRVGFEPDTVWDRFEILTDMDVREAGGRLMSVTSNWLEIRDGPTHDYAAPEAIQWGRVVRWTGNSIAEGGHTWYQVLYDDNTQGWARADRVVDYLPPPNAPLPEEGKILVPLPEQRTFSYYTVTDVDRYFEVQHAVDGFDALEAVRWTYDIGPELELPKGALFSAEGVAMQGSGRVTLKDGSVLYFELDNGSELDWANAHGELTQWGKGSWSNGDPLQILNQEDAEFRPTSKAPDLVSGLSIAGPPEFRGQWIYVPELKDFSVGNDGMFRVEDAGGAFGPGELRFDVFFEDSQLGAAFYRETYALRLDGGSIVYVQQEIPPAMNQASKP